MGNEEITSRQKMCIITIVALAGINLAGIIKELFGKPFLFTPIDRFMDYFNTLVVSKNVYLQIGTGRGYFPFTYVLLNIIQTLIPNLSASYFITYALVCIVIIVFLNMFFKKWNLLGMLVIVFLSYPMIFAFDRGNIEYMVFAFLLLFFICYKKEKYDLAAIILAMPICMKLYPALFAILFLKDKKYKPFIICVICSIFLMLESFILVGGKPTNLDVAITNFKYFTNIYSKTEMGVQFSHTIWTCLNYVSLVFNNSMLEMSNMTIYTIAIAMISLALVAYIIFFEKEEWKAITILTIMMITFPHVSFDYTLIHMYIPIIYFILAEKTKKWEGILYAILFGITIIPMNWFQTTINPVIKLLKGIPIIGNITLNLGLLIRPVVLMAIIIIIVVTTIKNKKKLLPEGQAIK